MEHTTGALVGHVEALGLYFDQNVASQRRGTVFRRVMSDINCRWARAGMCSILMNTYIKYTFISKGDACLAFELIRSSMG